MTDDSFNRVRCLSSESLIPRMESLGHGVGRQLEMVVLVMLHSGRQTSSLSLMESAAGFKEV